MDKLQMRTWAEVDLGKLELNYNGLRAAAGPGCAFMGMVKADAYGHGAVKVARRLQSLGCEYLGVACLEEAAELRDAGISLPIMIMGITPPEFIGELSGLGVTQTVSDLEAAGEMSRRLTDAGRSLKVHIKINTGMNRLGFDALRKGAARDIARAASLPGLIAEGVFTHFAVSDEPGDPFTREQARLFTDTVEEAEALMGTPFKIKHCANSGAVVNYPYLGLDMVRPGIALYGAYPGPATGSAELSPVMSLKSRVCSVSEIRKGSAVSYGRAFKAHEDMRIAVLPIGYADGLHRVLSGNIEVLIHGKRARQVGRICMDMCMVDITHIPECDAGSVATVFGNDGRAEIRVDELAGRAGTISYELLCSISRRVPRIYF